MLQCLSDPTMSEPCLAISRSKRPRIVASERPLSDHPRSRPRTTAITKAHVSSEIPDVFFPRFETLKRTSGRPREHLSTHLIPSLDMHCSFSDRLYRRLSPPFVLFWCEPRSKSLNRQTSCRSSSTFAVYARGEATPFPLFLLSA